MINFKQFLEGYIQWKTGAEKHIDHTKPAEHAHAIKAFKALGSAQRDKPEHAMLQVQKTNGGGVISAAVEHTGDLTHRMSHHAEYGNYHQDTTMDKVDKMHKLLSNHYGFGKEHEENLHNNAQYKGVDLKFHTKEVDHALQNYADEHKKLKVYNPLQHHAKEAAVAIGEKRWTDATHHLHQLKQMGRTQEEYNHHASLYHADVHGKPIEY